MSRCPVAIWRPLGNDPEHQPLMSKYDIVCIHTMVGTLAGTDAMFREGGYVGVESHFGTGYIDGKITAYQWGDTARTADANLYGNPRTISIENADTGSPFPSWTGSDVPAFTDEQAELVAQITAWACKTHDIPAVFAPNSQGTSRGIAYHRQGIDPYRVAGGEKWSDSYGKVCPGDRRVAQIHSTIIPRVQEILAGGDGEHLKWPLADAGAVAAFAAKRSALAAKTAVDAIPQQWQLVKDCQADIAQALALLDRTARRLHQVNFPPK